MSGSTPGQPTAPDDTLVLTGQPIDAAEALRVETGLCLSAFTSADKDEGVRTFLGKRSPHFTGQ